MAYEKESMKIEMGSEMSKYLHSYCIQMYFVVNETFDSVFDTENAESDEDALVNQVYDEIGLEFSDSVRNI